MASNSSGTSSPAPSTTFSYAQAIKGKASTAVPQPPSTNQTSAPPVQSQPLPPTKDAAPTEATVPVNSEPRASPEDDSLHTQVSSAGEVNPESSNTTAASITNEPSVTASPPRASDGGVSSPDESNQDVPPAGKQTDQRDVETSNKMEGDQAKVEETPPPKSLKAAPPPAVNFWTQRAQLNKQSTPVTPMPKASDVTHPSDDFQRNGHRAPRATPPSQKANSHQRESVDATQDPKSFKAPKQKPLSVQDATSWPTPDTAQTQTDEQRKKPQDKVEKPELASTAKSHGKNEWVAMPFTPSVKFNTPMPDTGRRGGRVGGRGGRGSGRGAFAGRNGSGGAHASHEVSTETTARGRSNSSLDRSNSLPPKSKRNVSTSQSTTRDVSENNSRGKFSTGQTAQTASKDSTAVPQPSVPSAAVQPAPSNQDSNSPLAVQSTQYAPPTEAPAFDATSTSRAQASQIETTNEPHVTRPRRKSQHGPGGLTMTAPPNGDVNPVGFSDGYKNGRQSLAERHGQRKGEGRSQETPRESNGPSSFRDRGEGRTRGGKSRGSVFGGPHISTNQPYVNGFPSGGPNSAKSQGFSSQFANSNSFSAGGRVYRPAPRSASIPTESNFTPYSRPSHPFDYPIQDQFAYPPMFAMTGAYPVTDPNNPYVTANAVAQQLGYYFSVDNLIKDMFLRKRMDSQGFVPVSLLAGFKRIKDLGADMNMIKSICASHPGMELRMGADGQDRVRTTDNPSRWVLPMGEREASAQNDGPEEPSQQHRDAAEGQDPLDPGRMSFSMGGFIPNGDMYSQHFSQFPPPFAPVAVSSPVNGGFSGMRSPPNNRFSMPTLDPRFHAHPQTPSPVPNGGALPPADESDVFPDDRIPELMVLSRPKASYARNGSHSEDRTVKANGSNDNPDELCGTNGFDERQPRSLTTKDSSERSQSRKIAELKKSLTSRSRSKQSRDESQALFYVKDAADEKDASALETRSEPYTQVQARALQMRELASEGQCPHEMYILYDFWAHFLARNFNNTIYNDFRKIAHEDASIKSSHVGMTFLINFYTQAFKGKASVKTIVAQHFIELVQNEDPGKERPAFKQLRSAWRDGATNMRNRKLVSQFIDDSLRSELDR